MKIQFTIVICIVVILALIPAISNADVVTLRVGDGYDANDSSGTLSALGEVTMLNTNDEVQDVFVEIGYSPSSHTWVGMYFTTHTFVSLESIDSVIVKFVRKLPQGSNSATLYCDVSNDKNSSLWSNAAVDDEAGYNVDISTYLIGKNEGWILETWDVSSVITSSTQANNMEVLFRNDDTSSAKVYLDTVYIEVTYTVDTTSPAAINDLSAVQGSGVETIDLSWSAPGDNGSTGTLDGEYRIDYTTYSKTWDYNTYEISIITSNVNPADNQYRTITGLDEGATYYFRIWTADDVVNWSDISNGTTTWAQREAPAAITDLTASNIGTDGSVSLAWSAPGDDGWSGTISTGTYRIDYATYTKSWDYSDYEISIDTNNVISHSNRMYTVTNLTSETTWYFRVWTADEANNWSGVSSGATDFVLVAPAPVVDFLATAQANGDVLLSWSAPGDDLWSGVISTGTYRIDYSTYTKSWDYNDYEVSIPTQSVNPYDDQYCTITGLTGGATYYFRLWTADEIPNWSGLSNGATCQVEKLIGIIIDLGDYDFGTFYQSTAVVSNLSITVINSGNTYETYTVKMSTPSAWSSDTTNPGNDVYALQLQFNSVKPSSSTFSGAQHGLTTGTQQSGPPAGKFAGSDETGNQVPAADYRHFWYLIKTPLSTSTTIQQNIGITITAEEYIP